MKNVFLSALLALTFLTPVPATSQDEAAETETVFVDASDASLSDLKWEARVLAVFADSTRDPAFVRQMDLLSQRPDALLERDVVIIVDTDPDARSDIRRELRPRGFALVIVDKDGRVMLRKPEPWDVREITRAIDKTPLRQQELREGL